MYCKIMSIFHSVIKFVGLTNKIGDASFYVIRPLWFARFYISSITRFELKLICIADCIARGSDRDLPTAVRFSGYHCDHR